MPKVWRIIDIVEWAEIYFKEKDFDNPRLEIEWLLCALLDCNRIDIYLRFEEPLSKQQLKKLKTWISRRIKKEPLQYITGSCDFYGRDFIVNPNVLIPRPETERLIDIALNKLDNSSELRILEVGTGSGCIAVTLGLEIPNSYIYAVDISPNALEVANINKQRQKAENVNFLEMDILKFIPDETFDCLISNPPYIPKEELKVLMKDVKDYEPLIALTDNSDGLIFYKKFADIASNIIKPGGYIILEVGLKDHPKLVSRLFSELGYETQLEKDFNGDDRVIIIKV
ncbi:MAG: peptide chain release factor N(5)-glutamine methyltransferase [Fidelibacterota bacterium]|jgi:release factor glutamine methyltransferase|tara:strand:+ start:16284 stop:17135 length:852 start_codon:yes stop_codon:yes gene_type:complete